MKKQRKQLHFIYQFMKFTAFQLFLLVLTFATVSAKDSKAQEILDQKISINLENVKLKKAISALEQSASVYFTYNSQKIETNQRVSIIASDVTLASVLNQIFEPIQIKYQAYNNSHIILTKAASTGKANADYRNITGKVMDESGEGLIGVNIVIKGTGTGTVTDFDGNYSIDAPDDAILVFSYTGYSDTEIAVADATGGTLNVTMTEGVNLESVTVLGSRGKPRTDVDRPVPIDVISAKELQATAQIDIGQSLHYSAPSFNAVKFGINDLAPLIDPASLRGLAPDQTLLLVNGKRRHKVSFFSLNHGVGKGQLGNDINAIPSAAIKRVEILRDGAAAQYGSDAIAGVMNMQLKDARSGGSVRFYAGSGLSDPKYDNIGSNASQDGESIYGGTVKDGQTFNVGLNFGLPWGEEGFINTTIHAHHNQAYDRSGFYTHGAGWYPDDPNLSAAENEAEDARLRELNEISFDRAILGSAENTNGGIFINAGNKISDTWDFYSFAGITRKQVIGGIFSRAAARTDRNALDIFPNGFNPETPSTLTDFQVVAGAKGDLGNEWALDFSAGYSGNDLQLYNRNTVNPSMGSDSPTEFYTGGLTVTQNVYNADLSKTFGNTSFAVGTELRYETFRQSMGQTESWRIGPLATQGKDVGSTGREGFSDRTDGFWRRNNVGVYAEFESDITEAFLIGGAIRFENYSDFGADFSWKLASRYKISDKLGFRASVNRSFRAPGLAQVHYSNFIQIAFDDDGNSVVTPFLPIRDALVQRAFGIENLSPETSFDIALGLTSKINNNLSFTLDAYQITLDDRIVVSGGIPASEFSEFNNSGYDEINIFTNSVDTKTQGIDFVANYKKRFENDNRIAITLGLNLNETEVERTHEPAAFESKGISLVDNRDVVFLTKGMPSSKLIFSVNYDVGKIGVLARATRFGEVTDARENLDDGTNQIFSAKVVTDLSLTFNANKQFSVSIGANNLFDVYPDMLFSPNVRGEVIYSRRTNQFGTNGRFINFAINYNF